jgi:hypothetical protein
LLRTVSSDVDDTAATNQIQPRDRRLDTRLLTRPFQGLRSEF